MASITGLKGFNKSGSAINKLLAAYGNDVVDVSTGLGFSLNLTTGYNVEFEVLLDRLFFQNGIDRPRSYDGSTWSYASVARAPTGKYIKKFKNRLYVANAQFTTPNKPSSSGIPQINFPSRVFYSDLPNNGFLTWGLEWGKSLTLLQGSPFVFPTLGIEGGFTPYPEFKNNNIKVGDPLFVTNANGPSYLEKQYTVASVESEYRLRLTENIILQGVATSNTDTSFWVGGNWFDVGTDDNDQITGLGENSSRLLIFKLMSLYYYTGSQLQQVKDVPGTSSHRSIINKKGYTYYFHGSDPKITGIYRYDGVNSVKISRFIDPFILGMNPTNYTSVVAWEEGEEIRFFLGDLSYTNQYISMTNAVATLNTVTGAWDVSPIADIITCATVFRTSNRQDTYLGTSDNEVLQMSDGNSFNGDPISAVLETKVYYPAGSDIINIFPTVQVIGRQTKGIIVQYKLWNTPKNVDDQWKSLGELDADKTELNIPVSHNRASGIQLRFSEVGTLENDMYIEKVTIFYRPESKRIQT